MFVFLHTISCWKRVYSKIKIIVHTGAISSLLEITPFPERRESTLTVASPWKCIYSPYCWNFTTFLASGTDKVYRFVYKRENFKTVCLLPAQSMGPALKEIMCSWWEQILSINYLYEGKQNNFETVESPESIFLTLKLRIYIYVYEYTKMGIVPLYWQRLTGPGTSAGSDVLVLVQVPVATYGSAYECL